MREEVKLLNFSNRIPLIVSVIKFDNIFNHVHSELQLIYVLEGKCTIKINDESFEAGENDIISVNSYNMHSLEAKGEATIISILLNKEGFVGDENEAKNLLINLNTVKNPNNFRYDSIRYLILSIIKYNTMENVNELYNNRAIAFSFFAQLVNDFKMQNEKTNLSYLKSFDTIEKITTYIRNNYKEKISLKELANKFNYSIEYLSRLFKTSLNTTFTEYYDSVRLDYAYSDLIYTNKTIEEIAENNGFENSRNFVRAFKAMYKEYPSKYRKKYIQNTTFSSDFDSNTLKKKVLDKILQKYEFFRTNRNESKETVRDLESIVNIDFLSKGIKNNKGYLKLIDLPSSIYLNFDDIKEELIATQKEIKFEYITINDFYGDTLSIFYDQNKQIKINYIFFDKIINFLKSIDLKPYLKFDFTPSRFSEEDKKTILHSFISHVEKNYDPSYYSKWIVSIGLKNIFDLNNDEFLNFLKCHLWIYETVKEWNKTILFASPSFTRNDIKKDGKYSLFLNFIKEKNLKIDFFSIDYSYNEIDSLLNKNQDDIKELIEELKHNNFYFENKMLFEKVNFTNSESNLLNDTIYSSSYFAKLLIDNIKSIENFSKFSFSDITNKNQLSPSSFSGGCGFFTINSIKKPSFFVYKLFSKLGDELIKKDKNYLITKTSNKLIILSNNYNHYSSLYAKNEYFEIDNENRYTCFPKSTKIHFIFLINVSKFKKAKIKSYKITKESASSYDKWLSFGAYNYLNEEEIISLKNLSEMTYEIKETIIKNDLLKIEFTINPLETYLYEIEFIN